ncbi:DNA damage-inducible transcript 4-like protein [Eriocheir sinensis]|uniref:DNA damage-inducible transcript 4-like protein n=1 Tax=Eriocheir sinensis TaxID=95602 RepID=UPI0021C61E32|nr:DNA damage-inducible transcript 4-like protein [Eriocheir sinensis]
MERVKVMRPNLYDVLGPLDKAPADYGSFEVEGEAAARESLVEELTREVRGRAGVLGVGEVVVPPELIQAVKEDVLRLGESEPCGLRGGVLHVRYQDGQEMARVVVDPCMPNTFDLFLTLQPDTTTWYHKMGRLIKPLRKSSPLLLSTTYVLEKRKLYPEE